MTQYSGAYGNLLNLVNTEQDIASKQTLNQLRVAEIAKINESIDVDRQSRQIARLAEEKRAQQEENDQGMPITPPGVPPGGPDANPQLTAIAAQIRTAQNDYKHATMMASALRANGGDLKLAEKFDDNARQARQDMAQGQLRLLQERKEVVREVGALAGTANEENFAQVRGDLDRLAPGWDRKLDVDFSPLNGGQPVWGPRTAAAMQTIANSSLTRAQQLDAQHKAADELLRAQSNDTQLKEIQSRDEERKSRDQARREGIELRNRREDRLEDSAADRAARRGADRSGKAPTTKEPTVSEVKDIAETFADEEALKDLKPADRRVAARDFARYRNSLLAKDPEMDPVQADAEAMSFVKQRVKPGKEGTRSFVNYLPFTAKFATEPEPARYDKGGAATVEPDAALMKQLDALGVKATVSKGAVTGEGGAPVAINNKAQFDALPKGTIFVGPDGKKWTK